MQRDSGLFKRNKNEDIKNPTVSIGLHDSSFHEIWGCGERLKFNCWIFSNSVNPTGDHDEISWFIEGSRFGELVLDTRILCCWAVNVVYCKTIKCFVSKVSVENKNVSVNSSLFDRSQIGHSLRELCPFERTLQLDLNPGRHHSWNPVPFFV